MVVCSFATKVKDRKFGYGKTSDLHAIARWANVPLLRIANRECLRFCPKTPQSFLLRSFHISMLLWKQELTSLSLFVHIVTKFVAIPDLLKPQRLSPVHDDACFWLSHSLFKRTARKQKRRSQTKLLLCLWLNKNKFHSLWCRC